MEERDRNYDKSQTRCANEKRGSSNSGYARKSNSFKLESSKKRWKYSCLNPECKEHHKLEFNLAVQAGANGVEVKCTCSRSVKADISLRIRHRSELIMRKVVWIIPDSNAECALIGRPILESMGINARHLLEAFSDKHDREVDVQKLLDSKKQIYKKDDVPHTLASLLRDGVFHSQRGDKDECIEDLGQFIDFGEDDP
eukprot:IDg19683t1